MNKTKVIVTLSEGGIVEVRTSDPEAVKVLVLDYCIEDVPGLEVRMDVDFAVSAEEFNDVVDEAIGTLKDAIKSNDEESDINEWQEKIEALKEYKIKK